MRGLFDTLFCALSFAAVGAVLPAGAALPEPLAQAFESYAALPDTLAPLLASVKDQASADAAAPKLHEQLDALYKVGEALRQAEKMSEAEKNEVQQRYGHRMREQWGRVYPEIFRIRRAQCFGSSSFLKEFGTLNLMLSQ